MPSYLAGITMTTI